MRKALALVAAVAATGVGTAVLAQTVPSAPANAASAPRDGAHDFDFNFGVWHTHITRTPDPFGAPAANFVMDGTVTVRRIWGGKGALEEIEADGPRGHWEGMTLFLYNPEARQWSQTFANSADGALQPSMVGSFSGSRGELYGADTFKGRAILVRGTWSIAGPDAHRYEEAYSQDGGRTWSVAFRGDLTRISSEAPKPAAATPPTADDGPHAFDFDMARWRTSTSRLQKPLTGSTTWTQMQGVTDVQPVWGGKANLAVLESEGPNGPLQLISLRLYDPVAKQWSLNFATSGVGVRSVPMVGSFEKGHGTFYDQEAYNGRMVWVRFSIFPTGPDSARSEQAFSADYGRTWETNFVNRYTRLRG
ncbi:hypothetical protein [Sphingomonas sp. CROZ-RG-20F-R02-07]|uniref:hypothetical protein n=1 Tax=Sphingomonas sp. CROZ-RG-20F-R02-07 TaxID=2914832 RepID=UPI001F594C19|nr:hypothetical protein [Sphingomonas sp. CROZ-RG-20F-R02-07]